MVTLFTLTLAAALAADPSPGESKPRARHPFAPSLPLLTDEEEERLDRIVDRFILFDTGRLSGLDGKKAKAEFDKLGAEATFALIRGLNKSAVIDHSCPVVTIGRKLSRMLAASSDLELLDFARENIGAGIKQTRHTGVIRDLRTGCMLRRNAVARGGVPPATPSGYEPLPLTSSSPTLSTADLIEAAGRERGERLKNTLTELGQRKGEDVVNALAAAATSYEGDVRGTAREGLARSLGLLTPAEVRTRLKDDRAEVRAAAARAAGERGLGGDLLDLLGDEDEVVRTAAHQALVRLNKGTDLGPSPKASPAERTAAVQRWRDWWSRRGGR